MTDNPTVGADGGNGAEGTPTPQASGQSQPPIEGDVTKLLTGLGDRLGSLETQLRGLQGRQDKSENSFRQQLARLNQYKQGGLSDEEALAEMEADDANATWRQSLEQKIDSLVARIESAGNAQGVQQMVATALTNYGLDPKDPFVAGKVAGQSPKNETEAELLAARILRDRQSAPQTNASQQSANPGQPGTGGSALDDKYRQLVQLQDSPTKNFREIERITKELEAAGYFNQ